MKSLGIYIHWPWCKTICPYCDFNVRKLEDIDTSTWRKAYEKEIENISFFTNLKEVKSIYFGGGTPSLISADFIEKIINFINNNFSLSSNVEITIEANPSSLKYENLYNYKLAGINRVSLGVQSFKDTELKFLGRDHDSDQAKKAIKYIEKLFFKANLDIIYGMPDQKILTFKQDLREIMDFAQTLGHLSIYQLTIEPKTPFFKQLKSGKLNLPSDEKLSEMYFIIQEMSEKYKLPQYEISNHSTIGNESIHNLGYWRYNQYLGIGPGAHSRVSKNLNRMSLVQIKSPRKWLEAILKNTNGIEHREILSTNETAMEVLITGLRLKEFLPAKRFNKFSKLKLEEIIEIPLIKDLIKEGLIERKESKIRTSSEGKAVLDSILYRFDQVINSKH
ncbi:MAG: Oxygen-independent coproporphyrinogen-III oxidase-like protein YqeR [Alphaproteobacteria bacterium MarineAlpha2_Bin1]|nr:MAG: Oxygen-independent coproporphyrinogen-III oxidase-like protein YqeR [Alphaproteobacteria bacterium MarineAlpha2_Bin1]